MNDTNIRIILRGQTYEKVLIILPVVYRLALIINLLQDYGSGLGILGY